ncbi:hypothetical protein GCM10022253_29880 [Sphingomonas endophytica]
MVTTADIEAMQNIVRILLRHVPGDAREVQMEANFLISKEGDVATRMCEYISKNGEKISFRITNGIDSLDILKSLKKHKEFLIASDAGEWKVFYLTVNCETGKVTLNLKYEE